MAIIYRSAPPAVLARFREGLLDLTGNLPLEEDLVHVPVWIVGTDAILARSGTDAETEAGCRFYARHPMLGIVASELTNPSDYGSAIFRSLIKGERAEHGWECIRQIKGLPEVATVEYELNLLCIPSLFVEAFYLRARASGALNLVVPVDLFAEALSAPVAQSAQTFLAGLRPLAVRRTTATRDPLQA